MIMRLLHCLNWLNLWLKEKVRMKIFSEIPSKLPKTPILNKVNFPEDVKNLSPIELETLADDVRAYMLYSVGQSGGHLGGGSRSSRANSCFAIPIQHS